MQTNKTNKHIFDIKLLPMDFARLLMMIAYPFFRVKKFDINAEKYKFRINGGAIIAANHIGFADPITISTAIWFRRTYFLVAEAVMKNRFLAFWLKKAGCIKIDRTKTDIEAIRNSVSVLKNGKLLLMFPQGKIIRNEESNSLKSGAVLMAIQANVPIIPVYSGARRHKLGFRKIVFGRPIFCSEICKKKFPSVSDMESISKLLQSRIDECKKTFEQIERLTIKSQV